MCRNALYTVEWRCNGYDSWEQAHACVAMAAQAAAARAAVASSQAIKEGEAPRPSSCAATAAPLWQARLQYDPPAKELQQIHRPPRE